MRGATSSSIVSLYVNDLARIKKYRDNYYVIIVQRRCRLPGYAPAKHKMHMPGNGNRGSGGGAGNGGGNPTAIRRLGERFASSIYRSRSKIRELGLCNDWDFLVTFTFDDKRYDRTEPSRLERQAFTFYKGLQH